MADNYHEEIIIDEKPAWRSYLKWMILGVLLSVVGMGLIIIAVVALDRLGKRYTVTSTRVIVTKGIISKRVDEITISHIRSMNTRQTAMERILGYGDIFFGTAGTGGNEIIIKGIKNPVSVKETIAGQKLSKPPAT